MLVAADLRGRRPGGDGLPVFDYVGFVEFVYRSVVQRTYAGFV
jgi:hypothetical protein